MNKKIIAITFLIIAILFVGTIAGTISYFNGVLNDKNLKISSLNSQLANQNNEIANLNKQISNLTGQVTNLLPSAYLVSSLGVTDVARDYFYQMPFPQAYNHLFLDGSVTNTGKGTAYNAGLLVVAYNATGTLEVNMTVPLYGNGAGFGTDNATKAYVSSIDNIYSSQLGSLFSGQTATVVLAIYHEGNVSNWTVTPVWTNSP